MTDRQGVSATALDALAQPTPPDEIRKRQGPGGKMLDYVDARFVMDRLDQLGQENWQDRYEDAADGSIRCGIGILVEGEWVWKWDVGVKSDIEPELGAVSHAFKRAGVKWGVARDLYGHGASSPAQGGGARPSGAATPPPARGGQAGGRPRPSAPTVPQAQGRPQPPTCPVHNWAMRDNRDHSGWFCSGKQQNGDWCDQRFTDAEAFDQAAMVAAVRDDDLDDLPF